MLRLPLQPECCELCERPVAKLTRHHLIPKHLHRKKRVQNLFDKEGLITCTLWVCRPVGPLMRYSPNMRRFW